MIFSISTLFWSSVDTSVQDAATWQCNYAQWLAACNYLLIDEPTSSPSWENKMKTNSAIIKKKVIGIESIVKN